MGAGESKELTEKDFRRETEQNMVDIQRAYSALNSFDLLNLTEEEIQRIHHIKQEILRKTRRIGAVNYQGFELNLEMASNRLFSTSLVINDRIPRSILPCWLITLDETQIHLYIRTMVRLCQYVVNNNCLILPSSCRENGNQLFRAYELNRNDPNTIVPQQQTTDKERTMWFSKSYKAHSSYLNDHNLLSVSKRLMNITEDYNGLNECVNRQIALFINFDSLDYSETNRKLNVELITIISELMLLRARTNNYDLNRIDIRPNEGLSLDKVYSEDTLRSILTSYGLGRDTENGGRNSWYAPDRVFADQLNEILKVMEHVLSLSILNNPSAINLRSEIIEQLFDLYGKERQSAIYFNILGYYHSVIDTFGSECTIKVEGIFNHPHTENVDDIVATRLFYPPELNSVFYEENQNNKGTFPYHYTRGGGAPADGGDGNVTMNENKLNDKIFVQNLYQFDIVQNTQAIKVSIGLEANMLINFLGVLMLFAMQYQQNIRPKSQMYENYYPEYASHMNDTRQSLPVYGGTRRKTKRKTKGFHKKKTKNHLRKHKTSRSRKATMSRSF